MASQFGPPAGGSGGPPVKPTRLRAPKFAKLSGPELDALFNRTGHELGGTVYLFLIGLSVFTGKYAGEVLTSIQTLQSLCRPPKPERGQWAQPPSRKTIRTALAALQQAGLIERDAEANQMQGQLRLRLTQRKGFGTP